MQNYINIVLGSKGGIGKTFITTYLAEYILVAKNQKLLIIDTDTNNQALRQYKSFKTQFVDFKDSEGTISASNVSVITETFSKQNLVIDTGANSYYSWLIFLRDFFGVQELELEGAKVI